MNTNSSLANRHGAIDFDRRREEAEWTLDAIAGAIVAGKLPPDDAFAWARIAAREAASFAVAAVSADPVFGTGRVH